MAGSSSGCDLSCPVCLRELRRGRLGKPENCSHFFCYTCILEWAKNVNTCPVDRIKFNHILVYSGHGSRIIDKVYVPDHLLSEVLEDVTYCEVCGDCNREDTLLLCDGCDKGFHMECLSPSLDVIPEGDWYCTACTEIRLQHGILDYLDETDSETIDSESESGLVENEILGMGVSDVAVPGMRLKSRRALVSSSEEDLGEMSDNVDDSCLEDFVVKRKKGRHKGVLDTDSDSEVMEVCEDEKTFCNDPLIPVTRNTNTTHKSPSHVSDFNPSSSDFNNFFPTAVSPSQSSHSRFESHDPLLPDVTTTKRQDFSESSRSTSRGKEPASKYRRKFHKNVVSPPSDSVVVVENSFSIEDDADSDIFETASDHSDIVDGCSIYSGYLSASNENERTFNPSDTHKRNDKRTFNPSDTHKRLSGNDERAFNPSDTHKRLSKNNERSFNPSLLGDSPKRLRNGSLYSYFPRNSKNRPFDEGELGTENKSNRILRSNSSSETFQMLPQSIEDEPTSTTGVSSITSSASFLSRQTRTSSDNKRSSTKKKKMGKKTQSITRRRGKNRSRSRGKRKRRKVQRASVSYSDRRDFTYTPELTRRSSPSFPRRRRSQPSRSTARTAASYTPKRNAMRSAVCESYKHQSESEGLEVARRIILASLQRRESLQRSPFRSSLLIDSTPRARNIETPQSGYSRTSTHAKNDTPLLPSRLLTDLSSKPKKRRLLPVVAETQPSPKSTPTTTSKSPLSVAWTSPRSSKTSLTTIPETPPSSIPVASTSGQPAVRLPGRKLQLGLKSKARMLTTGKQLSSVNVTPAERKYRLKVIKSVSYESDLLGEIHHNFDDLQNKYNRIERDGRVVPLKTNVTDQLNQNFIEVPNDLSQQNDKDKMAKDHQVTLLSSHSRSASGRNSAKQRLNYRESDL